MPFQVVSLRNHIEHVANNEPYMDDEVPLPWLLFQQAITDAVKRGRKYMSLDEVRRSCDHCKAPY